MHTVHLALSWSNSGSDSSKSDHVYVLSPVETDTGRAAEKHQVLPGDEERSLHPSLQHLIIQSKLFLHGWMR